MQAQRANNQIVKDGDSGEDEESPLREKPIRPPNRRKKAHKEPLVEEDIIDGFAILGFKSFEDLEVSSSSKILCYDIFGYPSLLTYLSKYKQIQLVTLKQSRPTIKIVLK